MLQVHGKQRALLATLCEIDTVLRKDQGFMEEASLEGTFDG